MILQSQQTFGRPDRMADSEQKPEWRVVGRSVRGASHHRAGLPNQDSLGWLQRSGPGEFLIVAASDGHGSAKYFRSHTGSRLAIEAALALAQEFVEGQEASTTLSAIKRTAEERLPQELTRKWREAVGRDLNDAPLTTEELETLAKADSDAARSSIEANPVHAYGATILLTVVMQSFILYFQLGDGDILIVSESGEVTRPLQKDERLFANETTSLSSTSAWSDFRISFQALAGQPPALILMSTDGYANSFQDEEGFLKVGSDILDMIRSDGLDKVDESLEAWLTEATDKGSGDDVTLAIICRAEAIRKSAGDALADQQAAASETISLDDQAQAEVKLPEVKLPEVELPEQQPGDQPQESQPQETGRAESQS